MSEISDKIEIIIQELIRLTKDNKIKWVYTDTNKAINEVASVIVHSYQVGIFASTLSSHSFYTSVSGGYYLIIEIENRGEPSHIAIVIIPSLSSRDTQFHDKPQSELVRLHNLIKKQFPNTEDFLSGSLEAFKNL